MADKAIAKCNSCEMHILRSAKKSSSATPAFGAGFEKRSAEIVDWCLKIKAGPEPGALPMRSVGVTPDRYYRFHIGARDMHAVASPTAATDLARGNVFADAAVFAVTRLSSPCRSR